MSTFSPIGPAAAVFHRAAILGAAAAAVLDVSSSLVAGGGSSAGIVTVTTTLVAVVVALWAGTSPDNREPPVRVSERWLAASALIAVAASYAAFRTIYEALLPGWWWPVVGLLLVTAFPIYALTFIIPQLLVWGEECLDLAGDEDQHWGALGPLVLGMLGGGLVSFLVSRLFLVSSSSDASSLLIAGLLLLIPIVLRDPDMGSTRERALFETHSAYGEIQVTEVVYPGERQPERRLYLNGEEESGELVRTGAPTLAYVAAAERWLADTPPAAKYLFLGGGAFTLPRRIAEKDSRAQLVVVELDPEITRVAKRFFGFRESASVSVVHGDGRAFLEAGEDTFDRIYVDVYAGAEKVPYSLLTREAVLAMQRRLSPGGLLGINLIGAISGGEEARLWSSVRTIDSVFRNTAVFLHLGRDFPDRQNFLVVGSDESDRTFGATAGGFELWPRDEWPEIGAEVIYRDLQETPVPSFGTGASG